jgi:hypothetical protein
MGALVVGWFVTTVVMYISRDWLFWQGGQFHEEILREILAAWTGELLFFTIVGGIITIISLRNPMNEGIDERIRIMFGRAHVPDAVMKYNKDVISRLSAYAKTAKRRVVLETYDPNLECYKVRIKSEYEIFNLFPDISYSDSSTVSIKNDDYGDKIPPEIGRVTSIRLDSNETVTNPLIIQKEGFTSDVHIIIPPAGSVTFSTEFQVWIKIGQPQSFRPKRVLEQFSMEIVSQCDQNARIEIDGEARVLLYNQPVAFPLVQGVSPGERIAVYIPLEPV